VMVCGIGNGTLQLATSPDSGKTWATYRARMAGQTCALSISPTDAKAVALAITQCQNTCSANAAAALYRSIDGGQHWTQAQLPNNISFGGVLGWAGTTLYATTNDPAHPLAVSVGGAPFVLRDDIARFSGNITELAASGGTMFAVLRATAIGTTSTATGAATVVQSNNDGAVWSLVAFNDSPFTPSFIRISQDGSILALEGQDTLVSSRNSGDTWQAAVPFPSAQTLTPAHFAARAPDGTLVALLQSISNASKMGFFILTPKTKAWQPLTVPPADATSFVLTWDAKGHPTALWANTGGHLIVDYF